MMRIEHEWLRGVAAMAGLANDTTDTPRRRQHRASRGRTGGVIARAQGRLFVSLSPDGECQPVGS
jgi:hypothetical protein